MNAERVREAFAYDPATGVLTWKIRTSQRTRAGMTAGFCRGGTGYRVVCIDGEARLAHRVIWLYVHGEWPAHFIDHINGDRSDNRLANLRDVPREINAQNQRRAKSNNRTSGLMGVSPMHRGGKWMAKIAVNGRQTYLGSFVDKRDAHAAYIEAKRRLHLGSTI